MLKFVAFIYVDFIFIDAPTKETAFSKSSLASSLVIKTIMVLYKNFMQRKRSVICIFHLLLCINPMIFSESQILLGLAIIAEFVVADPDVVDAAGTSVDFFVDA
jgi:hypothetical protein